MDNNELDNILKEYGWNYDNCWKYEESVWDCYQLNDIAYKANAYILLINGKNARLIPFKGYRMSKCIWKGVLGDEKDIRNNLDNIKKLLYNIE